MMSNVDPKHVYHCRTNQRSYVSLLALRNARVNQPFFAGCGKVGTNVRPAIVRNHIPDDYLLFVDRNTVSNARNTRAQPYVLDEYAREWIIDTERYDAHRAKIKAKAAEDRKAALRITRIERKAYDPEDLEVLPPIVRLSEDQGFRDAEGLRHHIDMRGTCTLEGIAFNALDVQRAFGIDRVYNVITCSNSDYALGSHYKWYTDPSEIRTGGYINYVSSGEKNALGDPQNAFAQTEGAGNSSTLGGTNTVSNKHLYLTYLGVVKLLFCSRSKRVDEFQNWAINVLFTHQFGNQDAKDHLAADLLGVKHKAVSDAFRSSFKEIPCIYLMEIGPVAAIRTHFEQHPEETAPNLEGLADHHILYKFGVTKDLARRHKEHLALYGKWARSFKCKHFLYVDATYRNRAETHIKRFFKLAGMWVNDAKYDELAAIPTERMVELRQCFDDAHTMFTSQSREVIQQKDAIEREHRHEMEMLLAEKDKEILRVKLECAERIIEWETKRDR